MTVFFLIHGDLNRNKITFFSFFAAYAIVFQMEDVTENQHVSNISQFTHSLKWQIPLGFIFVALNVG